MHRVQAVAARKPHVPTRVKRRWPASHPTARSEGHSGRSQHRKVYSRSYLPHTDRPGIAQAITFRLADSVPKALIDRWKDEIRSGGRLRTDAARHRELRSRIARYEDAGLGECHLRRAEIAALVRDALLRFDGERYRLLEWCVMPNHVHVLVEQRRGFPLAEIVKSWKAYTARWANEILGRSGPFWMRDYHDRRIRDEKHMNQAVAYVRNNPVAAGLCERPEDWPWSSAAEPRASG